MRRAVRHGRLMGIRAPFLRQTCAVVIDVMGGAYPALAEQRDRILDEVEAEEAQVRAAPWRRARRSCWR